MNLRNSPDWLGNLYAPCYNHRKIGRIVRIINKKYAKNSHVCELIKIRTKVVHFVTKKFTRRLGKLLKVLR